MSPFLSIENGLGERSLPSGFVLEFGNPSLDFSFHSYLTYYIAFSDSIAQALVSTLAAILRSPVPRAQPNLSSIVTPRVLSDPKAWNSENGNYPINKIRTAGFGVSILKLSRKSGWLFTIYNYLYLHHYT